MKCRENKEEKKLACNLLKKKIFYKNHHVKFGIRIKITYIHVLGHTIQNVKKKNLFTW